MPAASPQEAIQTSVAAELALVTGLAAVTLEPLTSVFNVEDDGTTSLDELTLPTAFPGAVLSLSDDDAPATIEDRTISPYIRKISWRAPVFVAIYASAPGDVSTEAKFKAWEVASAVKVRLAAFKPTGAPAPWNIHDEYLEPGAETPILIDGNTHGVLLRFYASYYILSPTP